MDPIGLLKKYIKSSGDHVHPLLLSALFSWSNQRRQGVWKGGLQKARTASGPTVPPVVIFAFLGDVSARCMGQVGGWPCSSCLTGAGLPQPEEGEGGVRVCHCADASAAYSSGRSDRKMKHSKCFPTVPRRLAVAFLSLEKGIQCISAEQHQAALCTLAPRSGCEAERKGWGRQVAFWVAQGRFPKVD